MLVNIRMLIKDLVSVRWAYLTENSIVIWFDIA